MYTSRQIDQAIDDVMHYRPNFYEDDRSHSNREHRADEIGKWMVQQRQPYIQWRERGQYERSGDYDKWCAGRMLLLWSMRRAAESLDVDENYRQSLWRL